MNGFTINNFPDYVTVDMYVVANVCDHELWFYGAYKTEERALEVADWLGDTAVVLH